MKALVAAACVAIIAGVGFYFIQAYQASVVKAEIADKTALETALRSYCEMVAGQPERPTVQMHAFSACRNIGIEF